MAINFYGSNKGFFDIAGKVFKTQGAINTSRGTTIPADIVAIVTEFNNQTLTAALNACLTPIPGTVSSYQAGVAGAMSAFQSFIQMFLILIVNTDNPRPDNSLTTALVEFIRQMNSQVVSVNSSAVTVAATAGTNYGDGVCVLTAKSGTGLVQENALAETLVGTAQQTNVAAGFQFLGPVAATGPLGQDWPAGSGATKTLTAVDANSGSGSLLTNGGFETFVNQANVPDGWICSVGVPGTTIIATVNSVIQLVTTGTPTGGAYQIEYTNAAGKVQATAPIAYNAAASAVQSALRLLTGLSKITVGADSGTTPNFTRSVTMTGVGGDVTNFSIINNMTGGSSPTVTPTITTHGTAQVFAGGAAVEFVGDGATLVTIQQQVTGLAPNTAYAVSLWAICDAVPAAGVVKVELIDGVGGAVINDAQAAANAITFNASALTTGWQHLSVLQASECIFRMPAQVPPLVYLRIRLSTAITSGKNMWIDQAALAAVTEFYSGGPGAVVFTGSKNWDVNDSFSVAVTNDRAGLVREYMNRNCDLAGKELLLPTSGTPTVPDSVAT